MELTELRAELERYHRASYGWALTCCSRDPAEAETVLQSVYVKVLEGKARYDGKASFKTWLFSVIRRTADEERRRRVLYGLILRRYREHPVDAAATAGSDEAVYRTQLESIFRRALAALPRRQQQALQLVFYHDLTVQEAAQVMGIGIGSARVHYDRGKKRLRQWLQEANILDGFGSGRSQDR